MYRNTNRYTKRIYHFLKEARAVEEKYQHQLDYMPSVKRMGETLEALERNAEKLFHRYGTEQWSSGDFVNDAMNRRLTSAEGDVDVFRVFGNVTDFEQFQAIADHPDATMV